MSCRWYDQCCASFEIADAACDDRLPTATIFKERRLARDVGVNKNCKEKEASVSRSRGEVEIDVVEVEEK